MNASTSFTQTTGGIIGSEPFPLTTFSLDIPIAGAVIPAGAFLDRAGVPAATAATVHGILAADVDATAATSGTVYLTGSFLRDRIISANPSATIDAAFEDALRLKGIFFERSIGT